MRQSKILVIGGGFPQLCLVEELAGFECDIFIADNRKNLSTRHLAKDIIKVNRYDFPAILKAATHLQPNYIASGGSDEAVYIMAKIAKALDLPSYISSDIALLPKNKSKLKKLLCSAGVMMPKTSVFGSMNALTKQPLSTINFPCVVKPDEGVGQTATNIVHNYQELIDSFKQAFEVTKNGLVVMQDYYHGQEIGVNGIVLNRQFHLLTTSLRHSSRARGGEFGVAMEKSFPATTDARLLQSISDTLNIACTAMNIKNAPIYAQLLLADCGVVLLEVMPRLGGGEDPRLVRLASGVNLAKATAMLCMGQTIKDIDAITDTAKNNAVLLRFFRLDTGTIKSISGLEQARLSLGIHHTDCYFNVGDTASSLRSSRDRGGYILGVGDNLLAATECVNAAESLINVSCV